MANVKVLTGKQLYKKYLDKFEVIRREKQANGYAATEPLAYMDFLTSLKAEIELRAEKGLREQPPQAYLGKLARESAEVRSEAEVRKMLGNIKKIAAELSKSEYKGLDPNVTRALRLLNKSTLKYASQMPKEYNDAIAARRTYLASIGLSKRQTRLIISQEFFGSEA